MRAGIGLFSALFILSACHAAPQPVAKDAWIRLPAVPERPGAAFFTLTGGDHDTQLLSVTTPLAIRTELHETMKMQNGAMTMAPMNNVPLPAGQTVAFQPGGKHVMLFDVNPDAKPGQTVPLKLSFADGTTIDLAAKTVRAGAAKP